MRSDQMPRPFAPAHSEDVTTPKRNEAVAWRNRSKLPSHEEWSGWAIHTRFDLLESTAHHYRRMGHEYEAEKLYPANVVDALQGEVSRLRLAAACVVSAFENLGRAHGVIPNIEARTDCENSLVRLKEALNLEPPTDGR